MMERLSSLVPETQTICVGIYVQSIIFYCAAEVAIIVLTWMALTYGAGVVEGCHLSVGWSLLQARG
jgi:hypothetical protein